MCLNCGIVWAAGKHQRLEDCVDALREELAKARLGWPYRRREKREV